MKLVHPDYSFQVEFQEGIVQKIIMEAPRVMSEFIIDIKNQIEGKEGNWVLSQDGQILRISDCCDLIMSIFDLEINQRRMLNVLYEKLCNEIADTELFLDWREINSRLEVVLNQAIEGIGYDVSYGELDLKSYLKTVEVKFQDDAEGYLDYLLEYLQLVSEIRKVRVFILVNASSFLTETEMRYLYEEASYRKYQLLLLEVRDVKIQEEMEHTIIVDKDYCVIDTSMK